MSTSVTEETRLLASSSSYNAPSTHFEYSIEAGLHEPAKPRKSPVYIIVLVLLFIVFLGGGDELTTPAQTRMLEGIYCRRYYERVNIGLIGEDGSVPEKWCKGAHVQGQVANLRAWSVAFDGAGMLLVSVPWGYFADSYGRKPLLLLIVLGFWAKAAWMQFVMYFWATLPLKLIWLSSLTTLVGGGSSVANAIIFTIVSDVIPEAERVNVFFRVAAASMATQFIGPFTSAILMVKSPWIPMLLGLFVQFMTFVIVLLLPETLNYNVSLISPTSPLSSRTSSLFSTEKSRVQRLLNNLQDSYTFLASDMRLLLTMPAFFIHLLIFNRDVLMQYISTHYSISLSQATVLISIRSGFVLLLCLILLPSLNHLFRTRWNFHPQSADLLLSRSSAVFLAAGFLFIGLAPTLPLVVAAMIFNTFGWGLTLFLRSLMTSLVEKHHVARLNTFLGVFDTTGLMVGSPGLALLFEKGVEMGGFWMGLPYFACTGGIGCICIMLAFVGVVGQTKEAEAELYAHLDEDEVEANA